MSLGPAAILHNTGGTEVGTASNALRIDPTGTTTQPVSGTFWQTTQPVSISSSIAVTGTFWQTTQPVSLTSLPSLATGSNTIGKVDQGLGGASAWKVDGSAVTQPVSGTFWQATQPVSTTQLPASLSGGRLDTNIGSWLGSTAPTVGQKTMAASIPVVIASNHPAIPSAVTTTGYSGSYPDPGSVEIGPDVLYSDGFGNLQTRGTVLTDEESFRDDFNGSSLFTTLTGTLSFTTGTTVVTGVGTAFTTELNTEKSIRLSSDPNSALERVSYIIDDENLVLHEEYVGNTGSGTAISSNWYLELIGGTAGVSTSAVGLAPGTTSGNMSRIWRDGDYLPFAIIFQARVSQRVVNQEAYVGLHDTPGSPTEGAAFIFSGTDNQQVICRSWGGTDSEESTTVALAGGLNTSQLLTYEVDLNPGSVSFLINGVLVASHRLHLPRPYTPLSLISCIHNTGTVSGSTSFYVDSVFWQNCNQVQVGAIFKGEPLPIQGITNGVPVNVQFATSGGTTSLPLMINLPFLKSEGGLISGVFKRALSYTVPAGYYGYIIKFTSFQKETATSRLVSQLSMGTLSIATNAYTGGSSYVFPQWSGLVQADVTTQLSSGAGNVTVTVTYTNELGVGSRTGTFSIPKGSVVGTRWDLTLASGDIGVQSIQNLSASPTLAAGAIRVLGFLAFSTHQDQSTTTQTETAFAPGALTFATGTVLGLEYAGGTVAKIRNLDVLLQLIPS